MGYRDITLKTYKAFIEATKKGYPPVRLFSFEIPMLSPQVMRTMELEIISPRGRHARKEIFEEIMNQSYYDNLSI